MSNNHFSAREWGERIILSLLLRKYYIFNTIRLDVRNFDTEGLILDIGGGGEGVIGRLKGSQVIAIDLYKDELDGIVEGPQKMLMDARALKFPDNHFNTVTAFFSLMYMKTREDHQKVMNEAWRVLNPAGRLLVWDIDLSNPPKTGRQAYLVRLRYRVGDYEKGTAYGARWPSQPRGEAYYIQVAEEAGFQHLVAERINHCMYLEFVKPA